MPVPNQIISQNALPSCWVFCDQKPVCGARVFLFLGEVGNNMGVSSHTHSGLMGTGRVGQGWGWGKGGVGHGPRVALCDFSGGLWKQGQCPGSAFPNQSGDQTLWCTMGCHLPGRPVGGRGRESPPAPPRPAAQSRPRPNPLGRAHW